MTNSKGRRNSHTVPDPLYMAAQIELLQHVIIFLLHNTVPSKDMEEYVERISVPISIDHSGADQAFNRATSRFIEMLDRNRPPRQ